MDKVFSQSRNLSEILAMSIFLFNRVDVRIMSVTLCRIFGKKKRRFLKIGKDLDPLFGGERVKNGIRRRYADFLLSASTKASMLCLTAATRPNFILQIKHTQTHPICVGILTCRKKIPSQHSQKEKLWKENTTPRSANYLYIFWQCYFYLERSGRVFDRVHQA